MARQLLCITLTSKKFLSGEMDFSFLCEEEISRVRLNGQICFESFLADFYVATEKIVESVDRLPCNRKRKKHLQKLL